MRAWGKMVGVVAAAIAMVASGTVAQAAPATTNCAPIPNDDVHNGDLCISVLGLGGGRSRITVYYHKGAGASALISLGYSDAFGGFGHDDGLGWIYVGQTKSYTWSSEPTPPGHCYNAAMWTDDPDTHSYPNFYGHSVCL